MHWGRVGDKCSISLCAVSLKIFNGGNRCSGRGEALVVRADGRFRHLGKAGTSRAERTTAPSERRMWLLKGRMSLAMPEALAHANLWEAKVRNLAWSEVLPPER